MQEENYFRGTKITEDDMIDLCYKLDRAAVPSEGRIIWVTQEAFDEFCTKLVDPVSDTFKLHSFDIRVVTDE